MSRMLLLQLLVSMLAVSAIDMGSGDDHGSDNGSDQGSDQGSDHGSDHGSDDDHDHGDMDQGSGDQGHWPDGVSTGPVCLNGNFPIYATMMLANMASERGTSHPMLFTTGSMDFVGFMPNGATKGGLPPTQMAMPRMSPMPCPVGYPDAMPVAEISPSSPPAPMPPPPPPAEESAGCGGGCIGGIIGGMSGCIFGVLGGIGWMQKKKKKKKKNACSGSSTTTMAQVEATRDGATKTETV